MADNAPAHRGILILLSLVAGASALASPALDLDALIACRALAAPEPRLACFDRVTAALASAPAQRSAAALSPQQKFGLSPAELARVQTPAERALDVETISAKVAKIVIAADGRMVVTLDSGQVWRQLVPGEDLLLQEGDPVSIVRGALGSFRMRSTQNRATKVTRIR